MLSHAAATGVPAAPALRAADCIGHPLEMAHHMFQQHGEGWETAFKEQFSALLADPDAYHQVWIPRSVLACQLQARQIYFH
eukprot:SAG31_NODE_564_length_14059_cov_5.728940_7_plen_81_part_00